MAEFLSYAVILLMGMAIGAILVWDRAARAIMKEEKRADVCAQAAVDVSESLLAGIKSRDDGMHKLRLENNALRDRLSTCEKEH